MNTKLKNDSVDKLFSGILKIGSIEECYAFFEDICTINEIQSIAQRFEVAIMLEEKKTYAEIAAKTGASTATISRVNRSLQYGSDGYKLILKRVREEIAARNAMG